MPRKEFSAAVRRAAWERANGMCEAIWSGRRCNFPVHIGCFIYEHLNPVWMCDDASLENCAVYCLACAKAKTKTDIKNIAKVKRIQKKRAGLRKPRGRPLPGTKRSGIKRKVNGQVVRRKIR